MTEETPMANEETTEPWKDLLAAARALDEAVGSERSEVPGVDETIDNLRAAIENAPDLLRERDEARQQRDALADALRGLRTRGVEHEGGDCWCPSGRHVRSRGHLDECFVARAALAKAGRP